jgi:hypothetical protein
MKNPFAHLGYTDSFVKRWAYPSWFDEYEEWTPLECMLIAAHALGLRHRYKEGQWHFRFPKGIPGNVAFASACAKTIAQALPWVRHREWPEGRRSFKTYLEDHGIIYLPHPPELPFPGETPGYGVYWPTVDEIDIPVIVAPPRDVDEEAIAFLEEKIDWSGLTMAHIDRIEIIFREN